MILYAHALDSVLKDGGSQHRAYALVQEMKALQFDGASGSVALGGCMMLCREIMH